MEKHYEILSKKYIFQLSCLSKSILDACLLALDYEISYIAYLMGQNSLVDWVWSWKKALGVELNLHQQVDAFKKVPVSTIIFLKLLINLKDNAVVPFYNCDCYIEHYWLLMVAEWHSRSRRIWHWYCRELIIYPYRFTYV